LAGLHAERQSNKRRSTFLISAFVALMLAVGLAFNYLMHGGTFGIVFAVLFAAVSSFTAYWSSDKVALSMSRARPADPSEYARLHNIVEGLAIAAGMPKPRVYIVDRAQSEERSHCRHDGPVGDHEPRGTRRRHRP
jgi:heat shock protein HtpX